MEPELPDGVVIIVDPNLPLFQNCFVIIDYQGETMLRQFQERGDKHFIVALNDQYPEIELVGEYNIRGIVSQRARCRKYGWRKAKHYV
jgi:SOS-response transcriptional repressor LexA